MSTQTDLGRRWKIIVRMLRLPFSICSIVATLAYMQPASSDRSSFLHPGCQLRGKGKFSVLGTGILLTLHKLYCVFTLWALSALRHISLNKPQVPFCLLSSCRAWRCHLTHHLIPLFIQLISYGRALIFCCYWHLVLVRLHVNLKPGSRTSGLVYFCQTYFSLTQAASPLKWRLCLLLPWWFIACEHHDAFPFKISLHHAHTHSTELLDKLFSEPMN